MENIIKEQEIHDDFLLKLQKEDRKEEEEQEKEEERREREKEKEERRQQQQQQQKEKGANKVDVTDVEDEAFFTKAFFCSILSSSPAPEVCGKSVKF